MSSFLYQRANCVPVTGPLYLLFNYSCFGLNVMNNLLKSIVFFGFGLIAMTVPGLSALASKEAPGIRAKFEAEQISDHVYVIHGPKGFPNAMNQGFMNNPVIISTSEGLVIIDPGSSVQVGRMVLQHAAAISDQPVVAAFATHIHGDHWLGNQAITEKYPDAKLYAHPDLIESAQAGAAETWLDLMNQLTAGATEGTQIVIPNNPVEDGDNIMIGDVTFEIHHKGKAHTTNDIGIIIAPDNVLVTGDLVFNRRLGRMDDGSFLGLIETLDHLIGLNPEKVIPGHGQTSDVSIVQAMRDLHHAIYSTVETEYESGKSDFEMKDVVVENTMPFQKWDGYKDGIGRLVSLGYLEVEENEF